MTTMKLEPAQWRPYFDRMAKSLVGKQVEIEVASLALGDQLQADWTPLLGISYDEHDDTLEILMEGLGHMIRQPSEIYVEEDPAGLHSMQVIEHDGTRQIVKLRDPLALSHGARH
jgi:hypothetical protein